MLNSWLLAVLGRPVRALVPSSWTRASGSGAPDQRVVVERGGGPPGGHGRRDDDPCSTAVHGDAVRQPRTVNDQSVIAAGRHERDRIATLSARKGSEAGPTTENGFSLVPQSGSHLPRDTDLMVLVPLQFQIPQLVC